MYLCSRDFCLLGKRFLSYKAGCCFPAVPVLVYPGKGERHFWGASGWDSAPCYSGNWAEMSAFGQVVSRCEMQVLRRSGMMECTGRSRRNVC